jgi:hypothetical protein
MNHEHAQIHKTHHGPNLGEATTFPFIIFFVISHEGCIHMSFCPGIPNLLEIFKIRTFDIFEGHNLLCKPPIEVKFEAKL